MSENQDEKNLPLTEEKNVERAPDTSEQEVSEAETKLIELEKQAQYYKDQFFRKAAEFENYKKRVDTEIAAIVKYANEELILSVLPIVDDLERSLKLGKFAEGELKGVEMIHQKFLKVLESRGVKKMETVGEEFDVSYHDALLQVPRGDVPAHTIVEEVEKGYLLNEKVIRHAKVIVSTEPEPSGIEEHVVKKSHPDDNHQIMKES